MAVATLVFSKRIKMVLISTPGINPNPQTTQDAIGCAGCFRVGS